MTLKHLPAFIRTACPEDELAIHLAHMRSIREICSKVHTPEEISGWGNRQPNGRWKKIIEEGFAWVVEFQHEVHGIAYIKIITSAAETSAHIFSLYLTPEVFGKGFGTELMKLMLDAAKKSEAKSVTLDSTLNAHGFYKKFGFNDSGPLHWREIGGSLVRSYPMVLEI